MSFDKCWHLSYLMLRSDVADSSIKTQRGEKVMAAGKAPTADSTKKIEEREFPSGKLIFSSGDTGGDLLFIDEGQVEIFNVKDGRDIRLTLMWPGEIIGVMTCLTDGARMASARALIKTRCRLVPHTNIMKTIETLPPWLKVVLKEYSARLEQMNSAFADQSVKISELEENQLGHLYYATLMVSAISGMADHLAITQESGKIVVIDDLLQKLEMVLNMERPLVDRVFGVLLESGLVRVEIEPERKRQVIKLAAAQKLSHFVQFVRDTKHGSAKKYLKARFNYKETRLLSALVKFSQRQGLALDQNCTLTFAQLQQDLQKALGVPFEEAALSKAATLQLITITDKLGAVEFKPVTLARTIACVEAILRLEELDQERACL